MNRLLLPDNTARRIAYVCSLLLFVGLIFSKFLLSLSIIGLLLTGLFSSKKKERLQQLWQNPSYWTTIFIFFIILVSALLSDNQSVAWVRVRVTLPLLALPIGFALLPPFSKRQFQQILSLFIYLMTIVSAGVLINYLIHFEEMQLLLRASGTIPTPNDEHIRFSLKMNLAVFAGIWLLQQGFYWKSKYEKWLLGGCLFFLIACIHIFSVRIGWLVLYVGLGIVAIYGILRYRKYGLGVGLLIAMLTLPYLAVNYIPSIRTKYRLTVHNIHLYQRGEIHEYSDTRRLLSYQIALQVAQKSPFLGVGIGDLRDHQAAIYKKNYPDQKVMYPHNMLLTFYAATGIVGLLLFLGCFLAPLFYRSQYKNLFFLLFFATITTSFLTENTLLATIGVSLYGYFLCFSANFMAGQRQGSSSTHSSHSEIQS